MTVSSTFDPIVRSLRGHLGRGKKSAASGRADLALHHFVGIETQLGQLLEKIGAPSGAAPQSRRNPMFFQANGRYLNERGLAELGRHVIAGKSASEISRLLGVSVAAAAANRKRLIERQGRAASQAGTGAAAAIRALSEGATLGGLKIKDLIDEGRG